MPRKNQAFVNTLLNSPWWISACIAALIFAASKYVLPNISLENHLIEMFVKALAVPAPFFAIALLVISFFAFLNARRKSALLDTQKNIESVKSLHWRDFEEMVAEAYRRKGYQVTEGTYGADGGIDLELRRDGKYILVQCKQWKSQKVGVSVIREMFGVLTDSNADEVIIICTGHFTEDAKAFASGKPISLIDGKQLCTLIEDVQSSSQFVTEPSAKLCPKCGSDLLTRIAKRGKYAGQQFLGCSSFPSCKYTETTNKDIR